MRIFLILLALLPAFSFACINDFSCRFGQKCIIPEGSLSAHGICVTPTDEFGIQDYSASNNYGSSVSPQKVKGCSFNTDCPIGFSCYKRAGDLEGICVK